MTPALALGERIAARGDDVLFLGTERGTRVDGPAAVGLRGRSERRVRFLQRLE